MHSHVYKCLSLLDPATRRQWISLLPLSITAAGLETGGAAAIFALGSLMSDPAHAATLPFVSTFLSVLPWQDQHTRILAFTSLLVFFYLAKNCFLVGYAYLLARVTSLSVAALSQRLFRGYLGLPYAFFFHRNSADLMRNLTDSVRLCLYEFLLLALHMATEILVVAGIVAVLIGVAPVVTCVALVVLGGVGGGLFSLTQHTLLTWGKRDQELKAAVLQTVQQSLGGIKDIKIAGREPFFADLFARLQDQSAALLRRYQTLQSLSRLLVETVFVGGILLIVVMLTLTGRLLGDVLPLLGVYTYAGFRLIPSINRIVMCASAMQHASAAVEQLYADVQTISGQACYGSTATQEATSIFTDCITLAGVSYTYEGVPTPAVQDLQFTIQRGESIGIVGPTGAGKSTLTDLLLGLLSPSTGHILIDGQPLAEHVQAWQRQLGYVPQSIYLIDDSLRRNIALGMADADISEHQLRTALQLASLEDFVHSLPAGLDTIIGEQGVRLSGGQRQRVAIARALYHEPELLIFDEATSALDMQTEREVTRSIEALHGTKTLVIVAHRLSTVHRCDRLLFLQGGRIAGCGTFDELHDRNADFRRMVAESRT